LSRLAKKMRFVRANAVNQVDPLISVLSSDHAPVVCLKGRQPQLPKATRKPRHQQRLLRRRKVDASLAVNQTLEHLKLAVRDDRYCCLPAMSGWAGLYICHRAWPSATDSLKTMRVSGNVGCASARSRVTESSSST